MPLGFFPFGNSEKESALPEITMSEFRSRVESAGKEWKGDEYALEWNQGKIDDGSAKYRVVQDPDPIGAGYLGDTMRGDLITSMTPPVSPESVPKQERIMPLPRRAPGPGEIDPNRTVLEDMAPTSEMGAGSASAGMSFGAVDPLKEPIPAEKKYLPFRIPIGVASGGLPGMGMGYVLEPADWNNPIVRAADVASNIGGMLLNMKRFSGPIAGEVLAPATRLTGKLALAPGLRGAAGAARGGAGGLGARALGSAIEGGVTFGVYSAQAPAESLDEWRENVRDGVLVGGALGVGGEVLGSALGSAPLAAEKASKFVYDAAVMSALAMHDGADPKDALFDGLVAATMFGATGSWAKQKDPYGGLGRWASERGRELIDSGVIAPDRMQLAMDMATRAIQGNPTLLLPERSSAAESKPVRDLRGGQRAADWYVNNRDVVDGVMARVSERAGRLLPERAESAIQASGRDLAPGEVMADRAPRNVADEPQVVPWASPQAPKSQIDRPGRRLPRPSIYPETTLDAMGTQQMLELMKDFSKKTESLPSTEKIKKTTLGGLYSSYLKAASEDSRFDKMSERLAESGDVDGYLFGLRNLIEGEVSPEKKAEINTGVREAAKAYLAETGKKMPKNMRKELRRAATLEASLPREFVEAVGAGEIKNKGWGSFTDWRRGLQGAGGRKISGNIIDKYILRPNERAHLIPDEVMAHIYARLTAPVDNLPKQDRQLFGEYMAAKSRAADLRRREAPDDQILLFESMAEARLQSATDQKKMLAAEKEMRSVFDYAHERWSAAKEARSGRPLGYREDAFPVSSRPTGVKRRVYEGEGIRGKVAGFWRGVGENVSRMSKERNLQDPPRGQRNSKYFAPHARQSMGKTAFEDVVTDPYEAAKDYAKDFARATVFDGIIKHNQAYSEYLRLKGYDKLAKSIEDYTAAAYAGKPIGADLRIQQIFNESPVGRFILSGLENMGQAFRGSTFTLNTGWTLTTQGTSAALPAGRYAEHLPQASATYVKPEFRRFVDRLYSAKMKGKIHGRVQDVGRADEALAGTRLGNRTKSEVVGDSLGMLSRVVEAETGYWTAALAYHRGRALGLEGKELANFMSDSIAKFQSMYDRYNRPWIMNSKFIAGTMPMQSFRIEMMNLMRESLGINGIGVKESDSRIGTFARFGGMIAAAMIFDLVTETAANKDNYSLLTPVPFAGEFIPSKKDLPNMPGPIAALQPDFGGDNLFASSLANVGRGAYEMSTGRPEVGAGRILRPFAKGGAQINATLQTIAAARGAHAVDLQNDTMTQYLISLGLGGPYATAEGKRQIEKYEGKSDGGKPSVYPGAGGRSRSRSGRTRDRGGRR